MNKYNVSYPNNFYDFSNGVDVSNDTINEWIDELLNKIDNEEVGDFLSIGSGNTEVYVHKMEDGVRVNVTKGYAEYMIYNKTL